MTGWLVAWLWQGLALVFVTAAALRVLPRINAATRYAIWWGVLLLLIRLGWSSSPSTAPTLEGLQSTAVPPVSFIEIPALPDGAVTLLFTVWLSVSFFKLLRVLTGLNALYRLKDSCGPMLEPIRSSLPLWREVQSSGRRVQLMICNDLPNAAVLGLHEPIVAFPPRLLRLVSSAELDQILLHEYGHVQRRDDWTRLAQALLEAAIWIHPATYLIGRHLNLEREVACDDWVVARTQAARDYAACLARVTAAHQQIVESSLVPALFGRTPDVLCRVDRLLDAKRNATRKVSLLTSVAGAAVAVVLAAQLRAVPLVGELSAALRLPDVAAIAVAPLRGAVEPRPPAVPATPARPSRQQAVIHEDVLPAAEPHQDPAILTVAEYRPDDLPIASIPNRQIGFLSTHPAPSTKHQAPTMDQAPRTNDQGLTGFTSIGRATRKASVALAGSLTKASVSLANGFQP